MKTNSAIMAFLLTITATVQAQEPLFVENSEQANFQVRVVAEGLEFPWDVEFLPDGNALISQFDGNLRVLRNGALMPDPVPTGVATTADGGLRSIVAHPDFADNGVLYFCYAAGSEEDNHTEIARGRFDGGAVSDLEVIFVADNGAREQAHHGCRLLFDDDGKLIATLGDRRHRAEDSQDLSNFVGTVVRLDDDGSPARGNPFSKKRNAHPEIFAYGLRNAQGAVLHPETRALWVSEHGPLGGDEVNVVRAGENYGWPIATYGIDYSGEELTDTPLMDGVTAPLFYWYPSVAPSSIAFYTGDDFPKWKGDAFVTTLARRRLLRLELNGERVVGVEDLFSELDARLRNVEMGPDGAFYVLTGAGDGRLLKIEPVNTE